MSSARSMPHGRELVEHVAGPRGGTARTGSAPSAPRRRRSCANRSANSSRSTLARVEVRRMRRAVALLPVADEVGVERRRPRHAAFEEPEVEVGEAAGHAAEEQRLGQRVLALGEHAEVVVDVARDRRAVPPARSTRSGTRATTPSSRHFCPHRVVVVRAVEAEGVESTARTARASGSRSATAATGRCT